MAHTATHSIPSILYSTHIILYACLWVFQVWLLSTEESSNWYSGLAVTLGDCDWLVFLLLWGGAAEPHWRPPAVAGHRSGWRHPVPTGQW